ncbi:MAG: peptide-binding protein [Candidatus Omnitrophica bacterium]|nr:peptide-binding protein [Candidatus Omnitrophota bacterium]
MKRFLAPRIFFAAFFFGVVMFAASYAWEPGPSYGGTVVTASIAEPSNLIPFLASDTASHEVISKIYNGLLRYNPDLELEGDLAERWEVSSDGTEIAFILRRDVFWQDGERFTSKDVDFTFRALIDPATPTPYAGDFERVERLETPDDYTVKVFYAEPFSPSLSSWTMPIVPAHLLEGEDLMRTRFSRDPVGTGPFRFRRWVSGERIELAAFETHFRGRPKIDRMVFRVIPDQTTMFLEVLQQSVDLAALTPLQYARQTRGGFFAKHFNKLRYSGMGYVYLALNLTHPLFGDLRVRQALDFAIDRDELIEGVLLGQGTVSTGPFAKGSWAYNPEVQASVFDPDRARQLLKEAGWSDLDGDGILERDGKPFEFTITTNQGNEQRRQAAQIMQRRLRDVGIRVRIKVIEWSVFLDVIDERRFDAVLLKWSLSLDPDPYDIWHSSKTAPGEFNFVSYANARVDELIEAGRNTFDREARAAAYREIHRIVHDEVPYLFLFESDALLAMHRRFRNVRVSPLGIGYDLLDWEVPVDERRYTRYAP